MRIVHSQHLLGKTLNLLSMLEQDDAELENREKVAIVQVPSVLDRFIKVPSLKDETVICAIRRCYCCPY